MRFLTTSLAAAALFIISATGQDYYINPDSVPIGIRRSWCVTQRSSCPLLCLQNEGASATTEANDCDADTLAYECICGNGLTPNVSEYSQTLPYFKCVEYGTQCVAGCGGNSECSSACRTNHPCGAQSPTRINVTSTTSTASSPTGTNSNGVVYDGFLNNPTATAGSSTNNGGSGSKSGAMMAVEMGRNYGLAVVLTGVFAGFALIL